jgi:hypothetical protein
MTTAYAQPARQEDSFPLPAALARYTAPAQSPEAAKVRKVVKTFSNGTAARGQSRESEKLVALVHQLQREMDPYSYNMDISSTQALEDFSYNHIPVKPVFSIQATYRYIGKLKPRQFPLTE